MKKHILFLISGILLFSVAGPSTGHGDTRRSVKIGIDHSPLLECHHENDDGKCIFRGILDYIAKIEAWDVAYIEGMPEENIEKLGKGEIDLISHAIYSKELGEKLSFTKDTIVSTWARVYAKEKSDLQSLLDLAYLTVGVVQDDPYNQQLRNIVRQFDVQCTFIEFKTYHKVFQALENKWIDAGVVDRIYGILHAKNYNLMKTAIVFSPAEFRFAVKKNQNPDLINALNYHISIIKKDPYSIYYQLINQTFDIQESSEVLVYLKWSLYVTASFLLWSTGVAFILKRQIKSKTAELVRKNNALETEIVQRRQAEEALEESEERYRSVFENTGTATIIIEEDMTISMVNGRAEELSAYSRKEIEGKMKALDFVLDEDKQRVRKCHSMIGGDDDSSPIEYEFRLVDKQNQVKDVLIRAVAIPETQRLVASLVDVTEKKRMEEERRLLAAAIEQSSESIFITDSHARIQYINPAFEKIAGYTRNEVIGQDAHFLYAHASKSDGLSNSLLKNNGRSPWKGRLSVKKKDGNIIETETAVSPIVDDTGSIINYINMQRDVTVEARLEHQLRQAQKIQAVGTLAGGIAHDFNNILAAIIGYAELAYEDLSGRDPVRQKLERVLEASLRARDLVKQILTFSRKSEQERQSIRISSVIKEAMHLLRASIPKTIEIRVDIQSIETEIFADATQIHQVLMNLCTNAAHAMRDKGGTLCVNLKNIDLDEVAAKKHLDLKAGHYVRLSVNDTGHGMDQSTLERIFEPFFTTKKQPEGSGMGLSVVHGIVKSHGGSISACSKPGQGSTFRVYFPRVKKSIKEKPANLVPPPNGKEKILLVDDEIIVGEVGKEMLENLGYHVVFKPDGVQALKTFKKDPGRFDLVITDQTMPGLTGFELSKELIGCRSDIPIILCTGFSDIMTSDKAKAIGIKEFVFKPYAIRDIAEAVRRVLKPPV